MRFPAVPNHYRSHIAEYRLRKYLNLNLSYCMPLPHKSLFCGDARSAQWVQTRSVIKYDVFSEDGSRYEESA